MHDNELSLVDVSLFLNKNLLLLVWRQGVLKNKVYRFFGSPETQTCMDTN